MVSSDGALGRAGDPYRFRLRRFAAPIDWRIQVFAWDSVTDPRKSPAGHRAAFTNPPVATRRDSVLDYVWSRPKLPGFPERQFLVVAEGTFEIPKGGEYDLFTISDDGIRVWIDDKLVIENWAPHESVLDRTELKSGKRRVRVEYYQVDGWVELRVDVKLRPRT